MAHTVGIIGSGIGALAVGIRLLSKGYQVTIFEARNIAGGKSAGVDVEGHLLDSGPTILRMPHLYMDLFSAAGKQFGEEFRARMLSPQYRVYQEPENYLDISNNENLVIENISRFSSSDANKYSAFLQRTRSIYQENLTPPPIEKIKFSPLLKFRPKKVIPNQSSVFQETSRYFDNVFIQQALSFHPLLFGRNPFSVHYRNLMVFAIEQQWGLLHIERGFFQLVQTLIKHFQVLGGEIALNTPIEQILTEKRKAQALRLASGKKMQFDYLISNLSPFLTQNLINKETNLAKNSPQQTSSFFILHLLLEPENNTFPPNTIFTTKNYGRFAQQVFIQHQLPEDPWLYLYTQTGGNNTLQPLMIMTPVPHLGKPIDWGKQAFTFRNQIVEKVNQYLPNFKNRINYERLTTPLNLQDEFQLPGGSALYPPIRRGLTNLYYVGDNTWTGLGLISALSSAEQVAKTILGENSAMV